MSPSRSSLRTAALVGALCGIAEAILALVRIPSVALPDGVLLLVHGCAGYGVAAAVVAAAVGVRRAEDRAHPASGRLAMADGLMLGIATWSAIHFVSTLVRVGRPDLAWLIPGCVLTGAACGLLVRFLALRVPRLADERLWLLVLPASLVVAVLLVINRSATVPRGGASTGANAAPLNIVLISVDTLRPDRLGCYGAAGLRTPSIDRLAGEGILFEQATSAVPLTGPSHTTMLTGLYPPHHGAVSNGVPLRRDIQTLTDVLAVHGYRTAAFVSGWTLKDAACGLASRFGYYDENFSPWRSVPDATLQLALTRLVVDTAAVVGFKLERIERPGARTTDRILAWLSAKYAQPFFLFAHYFDPHAPYAPPAPYDRMYDPTHEGDVRRFSGWPPREVRLDDPRDLEHIVSLYNGEVSAVDAEIGRLLDGLAALGLADRTLVIFTSDHGESLTEHGFYFDHGEYLYDTCVHVPLIIRFPDRRNAGRRIADQVRLVDLMPTVLDALGLQPATPLDGTSVMPLLETTPEHAPRPAFGVIHTGHGEESQARYYVREGGYKLIWNFDRREEVSKQPVLEELYNVGIDPTEADNLAARSPAVLLGLRGRMTEWWNAARMASGASPRAGDDVRERLRALGY